MIASGQPPTLEKGWPERAVPWTLLCGGTIVSGSLLALFLAWLLLALFS